jgi:hypothetical protein
VKLKKELSGYVSWRTVSKVHIIDKFAMLSGAHFSGVEGSAFREPTALNPADKLWRIYWLPSSAQSFAL